MGLSGSGKTTLARKLNESITDSVWFNADDQRKLNNDWDFSVNGRKRQAIRMAELAESCGAQFIICDFIAALEDQRTIFDADFVIWMDTIPSCKFEDTNKMFQPPCRYNLKIESFDAATVSNVLAAMESNN